jgi:outer membrane protein OmpA-like peptidoglycan-associated protein
MQNRVMTSGFTAVAQIALFLALAGLAALDAPAQTAPSASQMIEQLKAPRTRSLRNLVVEAAPAADAAGVPPAMEVAAPAQPLSRPSLSLLIQFDFDSARIKPESHQALANLSQALLSPDLAGSRFAVEGHTDAKGPAHYNLKLSEQRAMAVRDLLRVQGVPEARLMASGKGASDLANATDPFSAENRRVRIVNLD